MTKSEQNDLDLQNEAFAHLQGRQKEIVEQILKQGRLFTELEHNEGEAKHNKNFAHLYDKQAEIVEKLQAKFASKVAQDESAVAPSSITKHSSVCREFIAPALKPFSFGIEYLFGFPLIIDLKNDGLSFFPPEGQTIFYSIQEEAYLRHVGWTTSEEAFLVVDADKNAKIQHANEFIFKIWHEAAKTNLEGLMLYFDENQDCTIDAQDSQFYKLRLWHDKNQDGFSDSGEVQSLTEAGITAIVFNAPVAIDVKESGVKDHVIQSAKIVSTQGFGQVYDVMLSCREFRMLYDAKEYERVVSGYTTPKIESQENINLDSGHAYKVVLGADLCKHILVDVVHH